ncbi:MAG: saccharopine dehydrogenase family protein [Rudaea sp.]
MAFRYVILGSGRQGTAAAYDLARFGDAERILLTDVDAQRADASAERVNRLAGAKLVQAGDVDVVDTGGLSELLRGFDVCLSAVPYIYNLPVARQAIAARCSMVDLGGNSELVWKELALDAEARAAGVTIVPDCGVGPGLISNLAVYAIEQLDEAQDVLIYDGGLPQNPRPPFNYVLFFHIGGLTNEYDGDAMYIVNGRVTPTSTWDEKEYEIVDVPGIGQLEAFVGSGNLTTMHQAYDGKLRTLKNKILRYPGHFQLMKGLADVGLMGLEPVAVGGKEVVPRQVLHALIGPKFAPRPDDRDLMIIHIVVRGIKGGRAATVTLDLIDRFDEETGFSAMERTTGFHLAIVAGMIARGEISRGAVPLERAVPAGRIVQELERRGMTPRIRVQI